MSATEPMVQLHLPANSVGQIVDGLDVLIEQWNHTAAFLRTGTIDEAIGFVRECSSPYEAERIADFYREIREEIARQVVAQRRGRVAGVGAVFGETPGAGQSGDT